MTTAYGAFGDETESPLVDRALLAMAESNGPILHVIVIGFHHKKGCQVG